MSHQQLLILIELDAFDDRLLDPQQGLAIRWRSARRSPLFSSGPRQARNLDRERRALVQARSTAHGSVRRAVFAPRSGSIFPPPVDNLGADTCVSDG
jgi:hypothetical protein